MIGQGLAILGVALQSVGKVLYGTFLAGVSTSLFVMLGMSLTALVLLACVRFRLPREGRGLLLLANLWTAIGFIGLFFALKHLPPAIFAAIEIGLSLLTAIAVSSFQAQAWPKILRVLACVGIVAGCALLSWTEISASTSSSASLLTWIAIAASAASGVTSTFAAITCKKLAEQGWTSSSVLAHRFYLTIAVALAWYTFGSPAASLPDTDTFALIAAVGAVGILIPALLLQIALRRIDTLSLMICVSAQPLISFALSLPSPAYEWSTVTLLGVLVVTFFVGLDIVTQRTPPARSGAV